MLSTDRAKNAARQMNSLLTGTLRAQLAALKQHGQALCSPAVWDGPAAARFRSQQWPPMSLSMDQALRALASLEKSAQTAVDNIIQAGSQGSMGAAITGPATGITAQNPGDTPAANAAAAATGSVPPVPSLEGPMSWAAVQKAMSSVDGAARDTGHFLDQVGKGAWDSVKGIAKLATEIDPQSPENRQHPEAYVQHMKALGKGLLNAAEHPQTLAKSMVEWDEWSKNPGRAFGELLPALPLTVLTDGAGAEASIAERTGGTALEDAGKTGAENAAARAPVQGLLARSEAAGGHLIERHVGMTTADLAARLAREPRLPAASTFNSSAEAGAAVGGALQTNAARVANWVAAGARGRLPLNAPFSGGSVLVRGATDATVGTGVRVILQGNGNREWYILTGYPTP